MRIGIVGSGHIGGTAASLFTKAGHEVALSHRGSPDALRKQVAALGPRACAMTVDEAIHFGDVVLLAIPWRNRDQLPADKLRGKIVIDATNQYLPDFSLQDLAGSTSSEEMAKAIPGARIVKALNTIRSGDLISRGDTGKPLDSRVALLVAGDDEEAKKVVEGLIEQIGFAPVDTGSLRHGGLVQQAGGPLYIRVMSGAEARTALEEARIGGGAAHI